MSDIIQQMIGDAAAMIAKILTGGRKGNKKTEIIVEQSMGAEDLSLKLHHLVKAGEYNKAENVLFEQLEIYPTIDIYNVGLDFFETLDGLTDEQLMKGAYSREEIAQGIQDMTRLLIKVTKHREVKY